MGNNNIKAVILIDGKSKWETLLSVAEEAVDRGWDIILPIHIKIYFRRRPIPKKLKPYVRLFLFNSQALRLLRSKKYNLFLTCVYFKQAIGHAKTVFFQHGLHQRGIHYDFDFRPMQPDLLLLWQKYTPSIQEYGEENIRYIGCSKSVKAQQDIQSYNVPCEYKRVVLICESYAKQERI